MKRFPAVAGQFYPGDRVSLLAELSKLVPEIPPVKKREALAAISPHAGYIYSGAVAGETLAAINIPQDIVILGPNHHGQGAPFAVMDQGAWQMPLGNVPLNAKLATELLSASRLYQADEVAHRFEHSIEVQVPFLQYLRSDITITPIVISRVTLETCREAGHDLATAIKNYNKPVLIVASTDMTHYESREAATKKDRLALKHIELLDPAGLYTTVLDNGISMCGVMPVTVAVTAAIDLGATRVELIRYTDSGAASGDFRQVVGYAGLVIS